MPIPSSIADLSQTAGSNSPASSESPITADDYLRSCASFIAMLRDGKGFADPVQLASATTTDIGAQNSMFVEITDTTNITGLGTNYNGPRFLRFTGILTLTHNATTLNLPTGADITTAAGDTAIAVPNSTPNGWNVVHFQRASGAALSGVPAGAVTSSGLTMATSRLLGRTTASTGSIEEISVGAGLSLSAGSLTAQAASTSAAGVAELATDAETLAMSDTGRTITPSNLGAVLGLVKLDSGTVSAAASLEVVLTGYIAQFTNFKIVLTDVAPATDVVAWYGQVSTNGGSSYDSGASNYGYIIIGTSTAGTAYSAQGAATQMQFSPAAIGNLSTEGIRRFEADISNVNDTAGYCDFAFKTCFVDNTGAISFVHGTCQRAAAQDTDAFKFYFSSGNISSANWVLYGWN